MKEIVATYFSIAYCFFDEDIEKIDSLAKEAFNRQDFEDKLDDIDADWIYDDPDSFWD